MSLGQILFSPKGRMRRKIFNAIVWVPFFMVFAFGFMKGLMEPDTAAGTLQPSEQPSDATYGIIGIFALPWLCVVIFAYIKRWHDLNKSGWHILLNMIPVIGIIPTIYLTVARGTRGSNRFGVDPVPSS